MNCPCRMCRDVRYKQAALERGGFVIFMFLISILACETFSFVKLYRKPIRQLFPYQAPKEKIEYIYWDYELVSV